MVTIHAGATLTPHFRDFLPAWVACQPWYEGNGVPSLTMVGAFRLEDPAGAVGIETHLLSDGDTIYQIPMTYRGAPLEGAGLEGAARALIATADHSVLGPRWIYDGPADPVWIEQMLRLVETEGASEPSGKRGAGRTEACGRLLDRSAPLTPQAATVDLSRSVVPGSPAPDDGALGVVTVTWHPDRGEAGPVTSLLASVRRRA